MEFLEKEPIYLQISRFISMKLLSGAWNEGDRIPSVRDLAVQMEVNPNTVARTYLVLQEGGMIENRRGIGYFVASGALAKTRAEVRRRLTADELPAIFETMISLGLGPKDLASEFEAYLKKRKEKQK